MPPITLNRRRFLGYSAAASVAWSGNLAESANAEAGGEPAPVRVGVIGIGNRGTSLLRALLDLPGAPVTVICDPEAKHRQRGQGIVEKAQGRRPAVCDDPAQVFERKDVDALLVALPCDMHEPVYGAALAAGKHLYAEKPLALSLAACDRLIAESERSPQLVIHVGFQRRSNPRFQDGIERIRLGDLGPLVEARAAWTSSNGPLTGHRGWLGRRDRSGDFMLEQAVHIWDVLYWMTGELPVRATGWGRRGLFAAADPLRDVTDHYSVELEWKSGFRASFAQSWIAPADDQFTGSSLRVLGEQGGFDFATGALTLRDRAHAQPRQSIHPGPQPDTRLALQAFLDSIRAGSSSPPPAPVSLEDARAATQIALLARAAVDQRRVVSMSEIAG